MKKLLLFYLLCISSFQSFAQITAINDTIELCDILTFDVLANDNTPNNLDTLFILNNPASGLATVNFNNTVTYTTVDNTPFIDLLTYVICDSNNCDTASVIINVTCSDGVLINNVFTPNGDNMNDTWIIEGILDYPNNRVIIFNAEGVMIYLKDGYLNDWDGTWEGNDLPIGTYFYMVEYTNSSGDTVGLTGHLNILR